MNIQVIYYDTDVKRDVIEMMTINTQSDSEAESILRDARVSKCSDERAREAIEHGALDLR